MMTPLKWNCNNCNCNCGRNFFSYLVICHSRKFVYLCRQVQPTVVNDSLQRQASCQLV